MLVQDDFGKNRKTGKGNPEKERDGMTGKKEVFGYLSEHKGEYLSGEELAGRLHISRNAVWKAVEALRKEGHDIAAVTRKGYCLTASAGEKEPGHKINAEEVLAAVENTAFYPRLTVVEQTDSTNRMVKELALRGAPEKTMVIAVSQSAGKGRLGRSFYAPEGGIYMSFLLRPKLPAERAVLITTAAAVSVARAIEAVAGISVGIKWVNDIYYSGKKICGILTEAGMDLETGMPDYVVVGIGINLERQTLPDELVPVVGCLNEFTRVPVNKNILAARVWDEFARIYPALDEAQYMEEYKERSILLNREVTVLDSRESFQAIVRDITREGHLVVEKDGRTVELSSGDVSIKLF